MTAPNSPVDRDGLKACPFCGGEGVYCFNTNRPNTPFHWILCRDCHASPGDRSTEADARSLWNTRADTELSPTTDASERMREALGEIDAMPYYSLPVPESCVSGLVARYHKALDLACAALGKR